MRYYHFARLLEYASFSSLLVLMGCFSFVVDYISFWRLVDIAGLLFVGYGSGPFRGGLLDEKPCTAFCCFHLLLIKNKISVIGMILCCELLFETTFILSYYLVF